MFQKNTIFKPCESSGILKFKCIHVYYKKKVLIGTYGDFFKGSIRLIKSSSKRLKRNKYKSISILMRSSFKKLDGSSLFFKTNSCLNLKKRLTPLGKYVKGPVIYNMKRKKILQSFTKIILMKSNLFNYINIKNKNSEAHLNSNLKTLNLNFGPQHPAAHGVLRLILKMNNEVIDSCDPHIGLLHRGTEKLMENKIYIHSLPYFDRLDYVSTLLQEQCYSIAVDKLYNKNVYTSNLVMTRCVLDELTRVLNHLLAISCHALDVGSMSPIFWAFEEREKIMEFYERMSGARVHTALYKPFLKNKVLSNNIINDIFDFVLNSFTTLNEMHNTLTNNKIWKIRLKNLGSYDYKTALNFGLTGVMSRCTGLKRDLRLNKYTTYNNYYFLNFNSYIGVNGDSYDRFLLRMYEMVESLNIVNQNLVKFKPKDVKYLHSLNSSIINESNNMESIIKHFKFWSEGVNINKNTIFQTVESPKGEFSVNLISDGTSKPYRCKIRSPSFHHLQFLKYVSKNLFLSDLVTLIGTIDIVFGEVDR